MTDSTLHDLVTTIGIDLGKNSFHLIGMDKHGKILWRQKLARGQLEERLANRPRCRIGLEACAGAHHVGRRLAALGHEVRLIPAQYVKPFLKGHKNDYRDAEAIAEAVQRPTMRFVPLKSGEQLELQALHRVRSRLVGQRTAVINQLQGFLLEHGIPVRQGATRLRQALPTILAQRSDVLTPRLVHLLEDRCGDWRQLDTRIAAITSQIEELARQDASCQRLMGIPGVGPLVASAMVAAIGNGAAFPRPRLRRLARSGAETDLHRRPDDPGRPEQAWQPLPAPAVRPRGAGRAATARQLVQAQLRPLAHRGRDTAAQQRAGGSVGQQARPHRLGRALPGP
jgi:transposase